MANAAAFLDEAGRVYAKVGSSGYRIDDPYSRINAAMEVDYAARQGTAVGANTKHVDSFTGLEDTGGLGAPAAVASAVGSLAVGLSAKGNAYAYALDLGYSKRQAETYSILIGASEACLQYLLGGISTLGGKLSGGLIKGTIQNIDKAFLRIAAEIPLKMVSEGAEEYMQSILEPVFRNIAFHEHNKVNLLSPDAIYSFFLGAITAGMLEGPSTISRGISNVKAGKGVLQSNHYEDLMSRALAMDTKTETYRLASEMNAGGVHANEYNVGELIKTFVNEGGDAGFMSVLRSDPAQQGSTASLTTDFNEVVNTSTELTDGDINVEQAVADYIQNNMQANPESVKIALTDGMGILLYLEVWLQSDSGNINYSGFKADATSNAYVDFITKRGSMEAAAMTMVGDIRAVIQTQTLTVSERTQMMGVLAEMGLAEVFLPQTKNSEYKGR